MSKLDSSLVKRARKVAPLSNPTRLKRARQLHGWTQIELAERTSGALTSSAISQLEAGKTRPTAASLIAISDATGHPIEYFARHRGDVDVVPFFRSLRSAPARERNRAMAWAQLLHDTALVIEEHVRLPRLDLPRFDTQGPLGSDDIELLANAVRRQWELDEAPIDNVVRELERHGVIVAALPLDRHDLDAFSVWFEDRPVVVLGKDKQVAARTRFDAAHELGHLVLHEPDVAGTKEAENQAHRFAAALLMPAEAIGPDLPATADWRRLMRLKIEWGVSLQALLMRAKTLGVMNEHRYVLAMKQISARGWRRQEPGDEQLGAPERPKLIELALAQLEHDGFDLEALVNEAGLPLRQVTALLDITSDSRPTLDL